MTNFATYDGTTAKRTGLRQGKGWKHVGEWPATTTDPNDPKATIPHPKAGKPKFETTGDLKRDGFDVRGWALSKEAALAGETLYPLNETPAPDYDAHEEGLVEVLAHNAGTAEEPLDQIDQTWTKPPHSEATRLQRRQAKIEEGRQMMRDGHWRLRVGLAAARAKWEGWHDAMALKILDITQNNLAPKDVVWDTPPKPLNII